MRHSDAFPSKYMAQADVETPLIGTIKDVYPESLKGENGDEQKTVMSFREDLKPMILNNTNWTTCEDAYGPESDEWVGKKIEIYNDPNVMFGKKRVGGVRVRIPATPKPATNGNGHASGDMTLEQALTELGNVGLGKDDLKGLLPVEDDGKRHYRPERDSAKVRELVLTNTPPAETEAAF